MTLSLLGFSGSLRKNSYNTALLRLVQTYLPQNTTLKIADISDIPLYNRDLEEEGFPYSVNELRNAVRHADALVITTPEYNRSLSGVLKNVIDWISRPPNQPFQNKPLAILGGGGKGGTTKSQEELRRIAQALQMYVLPEPQVCIALIWDKFDQNGNPLDPTIVQDVKHFISTFVSWMGEYRTSS